MNKSILAVSVALGVAIAGMAHAADVVPVNFDGPNEGYNDPTPAAPVAGNPGTSVGIQRQIVAQFAADLWGAILQSDVPIFVGAQFNPLGANVLGSAGSTQAWYNHPNFPMQETLYNAALGDALAGEDLDPGFTDITSQFSSDFTFYLGLDGATPAGQISFLDVVMHEFGHGLGFANFESEATGTFLGGIKDIYSVYTYDNSQGRFWPDMTIAQRQQSGINYGNVVFTGASTVAAAPLVLDPRTHLNISAPAAIAGNYQYGTAGFGPTARVQNFHGNVVVSQDAADANGPSTTDGCSPFTNAAAIAGNIAVVDRGTCGFVVKALNAQAAGATGVIVANNAAGPAPGLGGNDPAIHIPTISLSQADGALVKGNAGVVAAIEADGTGLQGADDAGRPRLFMPNPVQLGSSGSHFDTNLLPNALMEPAINDSLNAALFIDNSANLLQDTGWKLNKGPAYINNCNTEVAIIDDAGFIVGANIIATNNLIIATSANKTEYMARMEAYRNSLLNANLISGRQGGKIMSCAGKVLKVAKN
jgi:hypothetical protein